MDSRIEMEKAGTDLVKDLGQSSHPDLIIPVIFFHEFLKSRLGHMTD